MEQQAITNEINKIYNAVEASRCGKLLTGEKDPNGNLVYNGFALQTFMAILNQTFKKGE